MFGGNEYYTYCTMKHVSAVDGNVLVEVKLTLFFIVFIERFGGNKVAKGIDPVKTCADKLLAIDFEQGPHAAPVFSLHGMDVFELLAIGLE